MAGQVIATKLYAPKARTQLVPRPRLQERLRHAARSRLTLVSAPAGFGKTTLLSDWMTLTAQEGAATAWLSLDPTDSDPATFWTGVVTALQTAVPLAGLSALDPVDVGNLSVLGLLTALLNDLQASPVEVWLVLDDFHLVDSRDVDDSLGLFVERLPEQVHVLISSRSDPGLPLSRWRARGDLTEVRASELRFTRKEATSYLNEVAGLELSAQAITALEDRTEGWIAALQLAALSMQGRDDVDGFITRFAGDDRYIVDYLVQEVLAHQPAPVREFLLESAVLDRLTGPLCDAVSGRGDGSVMLTELERTNLFIVPLDDRRRWYRYHHLFADVLRARMLTEQPELVPQLHRRASAWYERHDMAEEAVRHALAGADVDRATLLMESAMPSIRRQRQGTLLLSWLNSLPDYAVRRSPVLSVFFGHTRLVSGDLDGVEPRLQDAERALAAGPDPAGPGWADTEELRTLPATIAVYRASLAQARGDVPATAQHARRALDLAGPTDHLARASGAGFLGFAAWAQGDVSTAQETFSQAVESMHAAGSLVDELSSTVILADLWLAAGKPSTARRVLMNALDVSQAHGGSILSATAELHVALSELDREAGDLSAAAAHLEQATGLGEGAPMAEGHYRWFVARALICQAEGDSQGALDLLGHAQARFRPGFFPDVRPIPAIKARIWITQGNLVAANDWASNQGVAVDDRVDYMHEFDHLTLVRLLIARQRTGPDEEMMGSVLKLLSRLGEAAQANGRAGSVLEIRVLQALALDVQQRLDEAVHCLQEAWDDAPDSTGYARLFLDEGPPMVRLLAEVGRRGVSDHANRLLRLARGQEGERRGVDRGTAGTSADTLSQRELQVLRMLESELSGPGIAEALFVSHNTVRTHTQHIFTKLDVTNRRAAVLRGRELGLL
jgi:LuxR family transcriptional regulator, maltose regulon positive regulatory protein